MPFRNSPGFKEPGLFKPDRVEQPGGGFSGTSNLSGPSRGAVTTYYVDPVNGLDSNNGLGPDASAATNKPWKTMGKALGSSGITNGAICYMAPGVYRETVQVLMTQPTAPTYIIGDPGNTQGFKTAAGALVASGQVRWTNYTTDDKTQSPDTAALRPNGRPFLNFSNIYFVGGRTGNAQCIDANNSTGGIWNHHITFTDCTFFAEGAVNVLWGDPSNVARMAPWYLAFERCMFINLSASCIRFNIIASTPDIETDVKVLIRNCKFFGTHGAAGVQFDQNGGSGKLSSGFVVDSCSFYGLGNAVLVTSTAYSTGIPVRVINSLCFANSSAINAQTTGQIVEDYNAIQSGTPRQNVVTGLHSTANTHSQLAHFGQEQKWGGNLRAFSEPTSDSPHINFNVIGPPGEDFRGIPRIPLASGLGILGCDVRSNNWGRETTTIRTGSNALSVTGPGVQDFDIPVDATATTVSVWLRRDSNYVGPTPMLRIIYGAEAGVPELETTTQGAIDTWEQVSIAFTPTSAGIVTVRLVSWDRAGTGKAFADDMSVA